MRISAATVSIALLGLAGCGSAPTRLYAPYSMGERPSASAYAGPPVRIDAVHLPPSLARIEIVTDVARGEKKINDLDHWSAPLGQLARQTLTEDLAARLPPGAVIYPHLSKPSGALGIQVDILEFNVDEHGSLLMASYAIGNGGGTPTRIAFNLLDPTHGGTTPAATAHGLSAVLAALAEHIARSLNDGAAGVVTPP